MQQGVKDFDTDQGTSGLMTHALSHAGNTGDVEAVTIPLRMTREIANAAAHAFARGILPITFKYRQPRMASFANSLVEFGNWIKPPSRADVMYLPPSPPTVFAAITRCTNDFRTKIQHNMKRIICAGGGVSCDGLKH